MAGDPIDRASLLKRIKKDFKRRDVAFDLKRNTARLRLFSLGGRIIPRVQPISEQMFLEAQWLTNYTDDWPRTTELLDRLEKSLDAKKQLLLQGADGSWGAGYTEWYRKLEPTIDALGRHNLAELRLLPLAFMKGLEDWAFVHDYLESLRVSRISKTGRNNRDEFGAVMTALSQLIYKDQFRSLLNDYPELDFKISDVMREGYTDYLRIIQNKDTGFWGPSYRFHGEGEDLDVQDLSFTFHVAHYWDEDHVAVPRLLRIAKTILVIEEYDFPNGWRAGPPNTPLQFNDHNNYDVVTLLARAWNEMGKELQEQVQPKLQMLLEWSLRTSLVGDHFASPDGTMTADSYYFGVRFLQVIGFFKGDAAPWSLTPVHKAPQPRALARSLLNKFLTDVDDGSKSADSVKEILKSVLSD
jgi:hypothetical protein